MQVCVHIDVSATQVAFHEHLILLHVPAADHQVVLAGDEPAAEELSSRQRW